MSSEKSFAAGVPALERKHTIDDVKTALEASATAIHEAINIAREVWESDADTICFDIDDLVQIESALQEICNVSAGIDCDMRSEHCQKCVYSEDIFCPNCMRIFHSGTNTHYAEIATRSVCK